MSTRTRAAGILTAITMTAFLAACSATDGGSDATMSESSADGGAAQAPTAGDREFGDATSGSEAGTDTASSSGTGSTTTAQMERSIISSGAVSLTSKDVGETRREVQRIVDAEGGDITEENTETDDEGDTSYARLVIRVPSSAFGTAMAALEKAGDLRASTRGSDDVTTQVIDTGVRVRAQEASLKRVQQSWLADQTSLSTITVDITTRPDKVVEEEETDDSPAGFLGGLKGGTKALGASLAAVATILGALLPFAALALVLGLPIWLVVRRRRSSAVPQAPAA